MISFYFFAIKKHEVFVYRKNWVMKGTKLVFIIVGKGVWLEIKCLAYQLSVEEKIWLMIQWKSKKLQIISILVTSHLPLNTSLEHIEMLKGKFFKGKSFYIIYTKIFPYFLLWRLLTRLSKQIITILHSNLKFIHTSYYKRKIPFASSIQCFPTFLYHFTSKNTTRNQYL